MSVLTFLFLFFWPYPFHQLLEMHFAKLHGSICSCKTNTTVPPVSLMQETPTRSPTPTVSLSFFYIQFLICRYLCTLLDLSGESFKKKRMAERSWSLYFCFPFLNFCSFRSNIETFVNLSYISTWLSEIYTTPKSR